VKFSREYYFVITKLLKIKIKVLVSYFSLKKLPESFVTIALLFLGLLKKIQPRAKMTLLQIGLK